MKKFLLLAILAGTGFAFTGCETTGDPTKGGIFWSEPKAQDRLYQRGAALDQIQSDTSQVRRNNQQMQQQLNQNQ
jgi:hypothetical protein